jgi:hypothetical protein
VNGELLKKNEANEMMLNKIVFFEDGVAKLTSLSKRY